MKTIIVDSHCHLDYPSLADRLPAVLANAQAAGVGVMLSVSSRIRNFAPLLAMAEAHSNIYCTVGTHPHHAHDELDITTRDMVALARHPKVIGIGEAGLDYHYDLSPRPAQMEGFRRHIAVAQETGLPLVIHSREAEDDTARILEEEMNRRPFKAVLHCFTSKRSLADKGIELGLYVSFSGILSYKSAEDLRVIARYLPVDRLLVETDAPYLAPVPHRGKANEPAFVTHTLACLASTRGATESDMAAATSSNFFRLFDKAVKPDGFRIAA
jgi:TatD DNase family protein